VVLLPIIILIIFGQDLRPFVPRADTLEPLLNRRF